MVKCQQTNKQTNKQTTAIAAAADTGYNNNWHTELLAQRPAANI